MPPRTTIPESNRRGILLVTVLAFVFFTLLALLVLYWPRAEPDRTDPETLYVIPQALELRARPSGKAPVAGRLARGDQVRVLERRDSWVRVEPGRGEPGWAERNTLETPEEHQRRLQRSEQIRGLPPLEGEVEETSSLYAGPGVFYPVIGRISRGEKVRVYTRDHEFYAVDIGGEIAYAEVDAIDISAAGDAQYRVAARSRPEPESREPALPEESEPEARTPELEVGPESIFTPDEEEVPRPSGTIYASLPPGGVPPRPVRRVQPQYPASARRAGVEGPVVVRGIVRKDGRFDDAEILRDLPLGLGDAALQAVRQWRFQPATFRGRPIDLYYTVTVNFQLTE